MVQNAITTVPTVIFEATHRCNLDCLYCYNYWKADGSKPVKELSTLRTLSLLGKLMEQTGAVRLAFSGGEPLLRDDILELVAFVHLKGVKVNLLTNGALLDRQLVRDLRRFGLGLFQITLLGMDEAVHDRHCGPGSLARAMAAVETIRGEGVDLSITFILTKMNLDQIEPVMRFIRSLGLGAFMFNRFNPGGRGLRHMDELMPTAGELRGALGKASALAGRLRLRPFCSVPIPSCVADPREYRGIGFAGCSAATPRSYFTMDPGGNLRICNHSPVVLGNIRKKGFQEMANGEAVARFRGTKPEFCRPCPAWDTCLGSCRASSEQSCGSCGSLDPFVARMLSL